MLEEANKKNFKKFYDRYSELKEMKIVDMEQFNKKAKGRTNIQNPDMTCCSLFISTCMFSLSLFVFYSFRSFNNEFFNRDLIF